MSLNQRRLLYIIFIAIFFVITPIILFYAAGYNFNINNGAVERTGILIIKTDPKSALVDLGETKKFNWLYDFFYKGKVLSTPLKLRNLLPDKYELTITKDGYFDYHKQIELLPGHTVVLDDILLLKKSEPQIVISDNILQSKISPTKNKLALVTDKNLVIVDLNTTKKITIPLDEPYLSEKKFDIFWSENGKKIILTTDNLPVYNIDSLKKELDLKEYLPNEPEVVHWNADGDNVIFVLKNNILWQMNIMQKNATVISLPLSVGANIKDLSIKNNIFYVLEELSDSVYLNAYNNISHELMQKIFLPYSHDYQFVNINSNMIYLQDSKFNLIYIIDPLSIVPIREILNNTRDFSVTDNSIIYWNDFEIWSYNFNDKNKQLLIRISDKIDQVLSNENYIIYNTAKGIKSFEREDYYYYNMTDILNWEGTEKFLLNSDTDLIYFISWLDKKRALYALGIK